MSRRRALLEGRLARAGIALDGPAPHDIRVRDERMFGAILGAGLLGVGESYMAGWWDCERLDEAVFRTLDAGVYSRSLSSLRDLPTVLRAKLLNAQSGSRAVQVCEAHYDLGNDLFRAMLDERMVYTCGYWREARDLASAQVAKLDLVCRKLALRPGMRLLDIGCGWGSFMKFAAERYGVTCVGYSLSREQTALGRELCAGLPVEFVLDDYRRIRGEYDRVVSIGMMEAVGAKNFRAFMEVVARSLKPGGSALLHTMGSPRSFDRTESWYDKYIFPNGMIPSIAQLGRAMEGLLVMEDWHNFGTDYDPTLMAWNENFQRAWPTLSARYSPGFKRMWEFYLLSLAGSFRARYSHLWQIVVSKPGTRRWDCRAV